MSNLASIIKVEPGFLVSAVNNEKKIVKVINEQEGFTC